MIGDAKPDRLELPASPYLVFFYKLDPRILPIQTVLRLTVQTESNTLYSAPPPSSLSPEKVHPHGRKWDCLALLRRGHGAYEFVDDYMTSPPDSKMPATKQESN